MTLSDSSAAPGDNPTEEEIDSACGFQARQGQDPAEALQEPQGCGGKAEGWGPSSFLPAPSPAGIQQVD